MRNMIYSAAFAAMFVSAAAGAQVAVDGSLDAAYGAAKSTVTYLPGAMESNFDTPTPFSDAIGYSVYLTSDASNVYGYLKASGPGTAVANFANLYFDIDPQNNNGSDVGFEITNSRGFVAGGAGDYAAVGINYYSSGGVIEFSIPNSAFSMALSGLGSEYDPTQQFATTGSTVTLRLSQSFGYSVAGGATYGSDRLGSVTLGGAVSPAPEPATWAMMIVGFGLVGFAMRRTARRSVEKFDCRIKRSAEGAIV